jgi:hypothetical protein
MVDDDDLTGLGELDDDTSEPMGSGREDADADTDDSVSTDTVADVGSDPVEGDALAAVKQQSGASQRIQQEITRRKKLEIENEEYRRHILDMQRRDAVTRPITEDPEEERRRLEFMDEGQRIQYLVDKGIRSYQTDVSRLELQMNINADKIGFGSYIASNPQFKKYTDEVETEFSKALQKGSPKSRAEILTNLIGEEVIKKGSIALKNARQTGQDNIRRQQTRPANTRSGVAGSTRRTETAEETLRRRLAGGEYS